MRLVSAVCAALALALLCPLVVLAQSAPPPPAVSVPRLINISGVFQPADGQPPSPVEVVTLSIYAAQEGDLPLWQEMQTVTPDTAGRFTVLLGATQPEGLPPEVFASGEARWMGLLFARAGEVERPRVRITSVPYALKASDAETLGGRPASAYLLAPTAADEAGKGGAGQGGAGKADDATSAKAAAPATADLVLAGTTNFLAKYVNAADVGSSGVFENAAGAVGLGTNLPADRLHVRFTNTGGTATGLAVQNLGNTSASYSGMLFYDQNGALAQFQGFNNVSHEYRINNIASTPSINFMTTSLSRFFVASTGNIGIGTTTPSALLEVSNAVPGGPANMWMTSYTNAIGPYYMARRARGTALAPTAVQSGDVLGGIFGQGYGTSAFGPAATGTGGMTIQAAENWTNTAQGTALTFTTTSNGTNTPTTRMTLASSGNIGIGTTTPSAPLEVSNAVTGTGTGNIVATAYTANSFSPLFVGQKARGTAGVPTAAQAGDQLAFFGGRGYGTGGFGQSSGMSVRASETWTNLAQGTAVNFSTTAFGSITPVVRMHVDSFGNLGLGTSSPSAAVDVVREGPAGVDFSATSYGAEETNGGGAFIIRNARGTRAAPAAVHLGDALGYFVGNGYGTTDFGDDFAAGMVMVAAEDWTDAAHGALVAFVSTPLGANDGAASLAIMPDGKVGIGTFTEIPTIADKLQVFGDIRVGTTGTNGCINNFAGNPLAGTCASDRRFKKDVTPFGHVLDQLTALQPVNYTWRASEFPNRHFGDSRVYGLIAQDVEQVLPDLVVTGADGFKAVDYSKLPLLTIQAVKDLNDALNQRVAENDALKHRVAELERAVAEILATSARR